MNKPSAIASEELLPCAAMIVGRIFARVTAAKATKNHNALERAYCQLWWAVNSLETLAIAIETATHFSIATSNHITWTREMILADLGIDPETSPMWKFR